MENTLIFTELSEGNLDSLNGGGWKQAGAAFAGTIIIGSAPLIGGLAGIGASVVGTPVLGVSAGIAAGSGVVAAGAACLDYACK